MLVLSTLEAGFECADTDLGFYTRHGQFTNDHSIGNWAKKLSAGIRVIGMEPSPASNLERWMRDAGFINMRSTNLPLPVGPWRRRIRSWYDSMKLQRASLSKDIVANMDPQKEVGTYMLAQFLDGLDGFTLRVFANVYQWNVDEIRVFCAAVRTDACNMKLQLQSDL